MSNLSAAIEQVDSLIQQGAYQAAQSACRAALAQFPGEHRLWAMLGDCFFTQQQWQQAIDAYQHALRYDPQDADSWRNLGAAEHALGRLDGAEQAFDRSLALVPGDPNTRLRYALLQVDRGNLDRGIESARFVLAQMPDIVPAWLIIGNAERLRDNLPAAAAAYRQAIHRAPRDVDARFNLGLVLLQDGRFIEAEAWLRQLVLEKPGDASAWNALGGSLHAQARIDEALEALRHSVALRPHPSTHSKFLFALHYDPAQSPEQILAEHRTWDAAHARPLAPATPATTRAGDLERGLCIGFIAHDFSGGPTGCLGLKLIECLDKSLCSVVCYSDRLAEDDDFTTRFRAAANSFHVTMNLSDDQLAEQVRRDEIDVLVDLGGHVGRRLLVFARRPAPLQLTWLGYVGTTGLTEMDGLIADSFHVQPGEEAWYSETVLRMPHDYICYGARSVSPAVAPLPAVVTGGVTFGSFNNPAKYSPVILDAWGEILRCLPDSRLLLKYAGLDQPEMQNRLHREFARRGVSGERIQLQGRSNNFDTMQQYGRVDLALDTQPYSGGLTTCEALWMGVPVICCPGRGFASRHATSHVINAGFSQFVAQTIEEYVERAVEWANRLDQLAVIRSQMRGQMSNSPLCDGPAFARDWVALIKEAYERKARNAEGRMPN